MREQLKIAFWMTIVTTIVFGVIYPLVVTGLAQVLFPKRANGELILNSGTVVGSQLIGQGFSSPGYFDSRPSSAGTGYDGLNSGGSNLGPTNKQLMDRIHGDVQKFQAQNPGAPIPADLVTSSASGLDPDITPAAAEFQVPRVARERHMTEDEVRALVEKYTEGRQFGFLGERRVNVLKLNLDLDAMHPMASPAKAQSASGRLSLARSDNPPTVQ
jgi:potassium-transporting ATPase KdpC subunit